MDKISIDSKHLDGEALLGNFFIQKLLKFFLRGILEEIKHLKFLDFLAELLVNFRVELTLFSLCIIQIPLICLDFIL